MHGRKNIKKRNVIYPHRLHSQFLAYGTFPAVRQGLDGSSRLPALLTLNLLTTTIVAPPGNASKWHMGFNSAFKGLIAASFCLSSPFFSPVLLLQFLSFPLHTIFFAFYISFLFPTFFYFIYLLHTQFLFLLSFTFHYLPFPTFLYPSTFLSYILSIHLKTALYIISAAASVQSQLQQNDLETFVEVQDNGCLKFQQWFQVIHNTITYIIITLMPTFNPEHGHSRFLQILVSADNTSIYHNLKDRTVAVTPVIT